MNCERKNPVFLSKRKEEHSDLWVLQFQEEELAVVSEMDKTDLFCIFES